MTSTSYAWTAQDDAPYATEDILGTVHLSWVNPEKLFLQLQHPLYLSEKETKMPSTLPQPDGYTPNHDNQDVQKAVSPARHSTPPPDTSATPVAIQNLPFEDTPPRPMQATDQHKSASKCPSPVAPRRSSRLRRPRQLISMSNEGKVSWPSLSAMSDLCLWPRRRPLQGGGHVGLCA